MSICCQSEQTVTKPQLTVIQDAMTVIRDYRNTMVQLITVTS